jgi:hypothetical protein
MFQGIADMNAGACRSVDIERFAAREKVCHLCDATGRKDCFKSHRRICQTAWLFDECI